MDPVILAPLSRSKQRSLSTTETSPSESPLPNSPLTDAVSMAVIRDDLAQLEFEVTELITNSPSQGPSTTAPDSSSEANACSMDLAGVKHIVSALSMDHSHLTVQHDQEKDKNQRVETKGARMIYTLQATNTSYDVRVCAHCSTSHILIPTQLLTAMQDKISELALRGIRLVKDKARALQKVKQGERALATVTEECDDMGRLLDDVRSTLGAAWWEATALRSRLQTAEARIKELEEGETWITECGEEVEDCSTEPVVRDVEHSATTQQIARLEAQREADRHRTAALEAALDVYKQENSVLKSRLRETLDGLEQTKASSHHIVSIEKSNYKLMERIRVLEEENVRLINVEADCQALVEMRSVQQQEHEEEAKAWRASSLQTSDRIQEMQRRNAYLENRMKLCEEEKARMQVEAIRSPENLLNTSRGRLMGKGWNLSSMSLLRPRRRGDAEEGSSEYTIRR